MMHPAAPARRCCALELVINKIADRFGHAFDHPTEACRGVFFQGNLKLAISRQLYLAAIGTIIKFNQLFAASAQRRFIQPRVRLVVFCVWQPLFIGNKITGKDLDNALLGGATRGIMSRPTCATPAISPFFLIS